MLRYLGVHKFWTQRQNADRGSILGTRKCYSVAVAFNLCGSQGSLHVSETAQTWLERLHSLCVMQQEPDD